MTISTIGKKKKASTIINIPQPSPASTSTSTSGQYCPVCGGLECMERPRYFAGQLLTETELTSEQDYVLAKNRLHNRYLHGWGVVCGLEVVCNDCQGFVTVRQGYAIDPCGDDIVVCADQDVNFIKLVRDCQNPNKPGNCDPVSYYSSADCQDVEENWCLAIVYEEDEARPITALPTKKANTCGNGGCNCNCNGGGKQKNCGCGCHNAKTKTSTSQSMTSSSSAVSTSTTLLGVCEPTRIVERYHFCAFQEPTPQTTNQDNRRLGYLQATPQPGTLAFELDCCCQGVTQLMALAPDVSNMNAQQAYQACCQYLNAVRKFLSSMTLTHCEILDNLALIQCPPPPQNTVPGQTGGQNDQTMRDSVTQVVNQLNLLLMEYVVDCFCLAMLPKCPPAPNDNRVVLACITIKGDEILKICNFEGRHQVVTFPDIAYWLSFSPVWSSAQSVLKNICCGDLSLVNQMLDYTSRGEAKFAGFGNAQSVFRMFSALFAQIAGDCLTSVRQGVMKPNAINAREMVGRRAASVERELKDAGVTVTRQTAENWSPEAVAQGHLYTPTTVSPDEHVILHVRNDVVVGIERQDEVTRLQQEVESLRKDLDALRRQVGRKGKGE